jgi:hypothetical protein
MDAKYVTRAELLLQYFCAVEEIEGENRKSKGALKECQQFAAIEELLGDDCLSGSALGSMQVAIA